MRYVKQLRFIGQTELGKTLNRPLVEFMNKSLTDEELADSIQRTSSINKTMQADRYIP